MNRENNSCFLVKKQFFIALFVLAPVSAVLAQAPQAVEDGTWRGTYSCSEGAPAFANLTPFSFPMSFVVANRTATNRTDNTDLREQMVLRFDGRGSAGVEVDGERKTNARGTWSIKASGAVMNGRLKATGPMFRADGTTLVRATCLFDLTRVVGDGAGAPARPSAGPTPEPVGKAPGLVKPVTADTAKAADPPQPAVAPPTLTAPAPVLAAPVSPQPAPVVTAPPVPDRAKAIKDAIAFLTAQDIARAGRQADGQEVAQATKVSLALMDGLGSLGVSMFLDTRSPLFKRDLAGHATLGDGRMPTDILLLDAATRIPQHRLSTLAALSLEPANPASAATPDMNGYLLLLGEALGRALASKGIQAAPTAQDPKPKFSFTFAPLDWARNRMEAIELIGAGRQFPLIIVYNAQIDPVQGNEVVLYEQSDRRYDVAKSHDAYMRMVQQVQDRLNDAGLLRLATLSAADIAAARAEKLAAARVAGDRAMQEMLDRIERINTAARTHSELVGSLRIYRKGKPIAGKPENGLCTVKAEDGVMLRGLAAAPAFLEFTKVPAKSRFSFVADTPDALFAAVTADKCYIVVDYAANLQQYMAALGRDGIFAYNVGPTADRGEAQEPFAVSVGYENWRDYQFADAIAGDATPGKLRELKSYKVMDEAGFKAVVARMRSEAYGDTDAPDVDDVLSYLADDAEGRKNGQSAKAYRQAENARRAAEQRAREQAAAVQAAEKAKAFPYIAIFTCGMGNGHINILACFASQGSSRVDTELKLTNGEESEMFKAYTLSRAGKEQRDGFYIDLRERFSILAQNSHDSLILGLKVVDRVSGKVLYQNQAARFGVLGIAN